jgi:hypothetical protein
VLDWDRNSKLLWCYNARKHRIHLKKNLLASMNPVDRAFRSGDGRIASVNVVAQLKRTEQLHELSLQVADPAAADYWLKRSACNFLIDHNSYPANIFKAKILGASLIDDPLD